MRYLAAVSGGVDSVVLLDMLAHEDGHEIVVAHFDHGIRPDSAADARFVAALAARYGFPFVTRREELGARASEALARTRRYAFLRGEAATRHAVIATAHHQDDLVETVAINLVRGTGWRGLAVLSAPDVVRPLLALTKCDIYDYARDHRLEWVEDDTNATEAYLRNRVRHRLAGVPEEDRQALIELWERQCSLKTQIDTEAARFTCGGGEYERYFFTQLDEPSALELLRAAIIGVGAAPSTRPQLGRALLAIKTARPGSVFEVGGGVALRFTARGFIVTTP